MCRPVPFTHKPLMERQMMMLKWFVDEEVAEDALKQGRLINEEEVEVDPNNISSSCLEKFINLNVIQQFFTSDGWLSVENVLKIKSSRLTWKCGSCTHDCSSGDTILCEACLSWFHYTCVGLLQTPRKKYWFCHSCSNI